MQKSKELTGIIFLLIAEEYLDLSWISLNSVTISYVLVIIGSQKWIISTERIV